jgi:polar amino acid transport system ATP-binding protein
MNITLIVKNLSFYSQKASFLNKFWRIFSLSKRKNKPYNTSEVNQLYSSQNYSAENNEILRNISIYLRQSDSPIIITGPSGSGKSTFLRCLNFLEPFTGSIFLNELELTQKNIHKYRKKIGFIFQESGLFPNMTAMKNITYTAVKIHKQNRLEVEKKALDLMQKLGIIDQKDSYPHQLSGGEKQKVSIIRSIILDPQIIFLDEPTSALDSKSTESLIQVLKEMHCMKIIVTHDMNFAKKIGKTILEFENGKIVRCLQKS